jgi:hypothetical protein
VVVYHPHETFGLEILAYRRFAQEGLAQGRLELLGSALHGVHRDFLFRLRGGDGADGGAFASGFSNAERSDAAARLQALFDEPSAQFSPPFGVIHVPAEGQTVAAGSWGMGWALDDSGIAEIRIATELGPAGLAQLGGRWPGLAENFPDFPDAAHGGYGFEVPVVPPGPHILSVTLVARDGGVTEMKRPIVVAPIANPAPAASPRPTGPGS